MTIKMKIIAALSLTLGTLGCAKSDNNPAPEIAQHKAIECPPNIEGTYKGKTKSGADATIEFFRDEEKILLHRMTLKGHEEEAVTVAVNGQKHTFEGANGYISMGCQNSKISGINSLNNVTYKGQFSLDGDDLVVAASAPQAFEVRYKRVSGTN